MISPYVTDRQSYNTYGYGTTSNSINDFYQTATTSTGTYVPGGQYWYPIRFVGLSDYISTDYGHYNEPIAERPSIERPVEPPKDIPKPDTKAIEMAKALLLEHLDDDNKKRFLGDGPIEINSKIFSDIKYQIWLGKMDKIRALKEGETVDRLCLLVKEPKVLPREDIILAKLLHILHNEEEMLKVAKHYPDTENLLDRMNS